MNPETLLDYFVLFIIFIKLIFSFTYFSHLFLLYIDLHKFGKIDKIEKIDKELLLWKERTEFIFSICMSFYSSIIFILNLVVYPFAKRQKYCSYFLALSFCSLPNGLSSLMRTLFLFK